MLNKSLAEESSSPSEDDPRRRCYKLTRLGRGILTAEVARLESIVREAHSFLPADLATIHVECSKGRGNACPPETRATAGIPVSDFPPAINNKGARERGVAERNVLVIVDLYVRSFFDRYLRGGSNQLLGGSTLPLRNVEVHRCAASRGHV